MENFVNRGYKGKSVKTANATDAQLVTETRAKMKSKPVVESVGISKPMIFSEIQKDPSAILLNFGVQDQAIFDILSGKAEPTALLPMQMPANMASVEKQAEDVPFDLQCHRDTDGHVYDFGFGMNWKGVIKDRRVKKHRK